MASWLFIGSCALFYIFSSLAAIKYGSSDTSLSGACRLDCGWYRSILEDGYHTKPSGHPKGDAANWAFFPLFPLAASFLSFLTGADPSLALVLASKLFLFGSIFVFIIFAKREFGEHSRLPAGILVAFNPYIMYAHSGYSETLYFLITSLCFMAVGNRHWLFAAIASALLSATRFVGILFGIVLIEAIAKNQVLKNKNLWPKLVIALLLSPFGLLCFMVYLHKHVGDALAFMHVQVAWGRYLQNPLDVVVKAFFHGRWDLYFVMCAIAGLAVGGWLLWRRRYGYALFLIGSILVPLSTGVNSLPRYVFWQFPFLLGLLELLIMNRIIKNFYYIFSFLIASFLILAWFTGKSFVI